MIIGGPRAFNIFACSEIIKGISLDWINFKRFLGIIKEILKRSIVNNLFIYLFKIAK